MKIHIEYRGEPTEVSVTSGLPLALVQHYEKLVSHLRDDAPVTAETLLTLQERARGLAAQIQGLEASNRQLAKQVDAAQYRARNMEGARNSAVEALHILLRSGLSPEQTLVVEGTLKRIDPTPEERSRMPGGSNYPPSDEGDPS